MNIDKYFNELIKRIENPSEFNILISLSELVENLTTDEKIELDDKLKIIGVSKGYFNIINDETGWYSLSELGIELKESNELYKKFEKKRNSKPMTKFEKWSLILVIVGIILGSFWKCYDIYKAVPESNQSSHTSDSLKPKTYNKVEDKEKTLLDTSKTKTELD